MRHFKPLILAALNRISAGDSTETSKTLVGLVSEIERFVFVMYELCGYAANNSARGYFVDYPHEVFLNSESYSFEEIREDLGAYLYSFDEEDEFVGSFGPEEFVNSVNARFIKNKGWYSWDALKYFLSEWDMHLAGTPGLLVTADRYADLSVEHIMPQNPSAPGQWMENQRALKKEFKFVVNDLGNLLLLGVGANKAVKDIDLRSKADAYKTSVAGKEVLNRAGKSIAWGQKEIHARGIAMVEFLRARWRLPGQESNSDLRIDAASILSKGLKFRRKPLR